MSSSIEYKKITKWSTEIFNQIGVPLEEAETIGRALTTTSLWGIDSHGIARIPHYLTRFENGTINTNPTLRFTKTAAGTGQLDGNDGHGIAIMTNGANEAIHLAKDAGVGVVGISNSSHCGAIGLYTRQITQAGMIGIAFTHADALVVPYKGDKPFFGTNPISIAFPTENNDEPICLDMATSIVPWNYIINARREKINVPAGIGVDKNGHDNSNPNEIIAVNPMAEHKGYGLAFLIDMLCGPLNGMNFGPNMTSMYKELNKKRKLGSLVIAIDPARFGGKDTIRKVGTTVINQIRTYGNHILFPGQPEYVCKKEREKTGIPVSETTALEFKQWSYKLGVTSLT